jgi:hypothetical protein
MCDDSLTVVASAVHAVEGSELTARSPGLAHGYQPTLERKQSIIP